MRGSLSSTAHCLEFLTGHILPKIYSSWNWQWMTTIQTEEYNFKLVSNSPLTNSILVRKHCCNVLGNCCGVVTDIVLHWNWVEYKYLGCALSCPQWPLQPLHLSTFKVWAFLCSVTRALDLVCLRFMGPSSPLFCCLNRALRGLRYLVCTVVARPQQVWVQIQGKGGAWQCSWAKTQPRSPLIHSQLAFANSLKLTPAQLCLKSAKSGKCCLGQK